MGTDENICKIGGKITVMTETSGIEFTILQELGEGSMDKVWLVKHNNILFAVKVPTFLTHSIKKRNRQINRICFSAFS
jgi:hypothetical protein